LIVGIKQGCGSAIEQRQGRALVRIDVASGEEVVLHVEAAESGGLDVSPDGRWLAFRRGSDRIAVIPSTGGVVRDVHRFPDREANELNTNVRWTPDGKRLLFTRRGSELWSVDVWTGAARPLASDLDGIRSVAMHPDGRRVAITLERSATELWAVEGFLPR
jgi:Tol biopolymer transport system component